MPYHWKALFIVMIVTTIAFMVAKPSLVRFMSAADFAVRRNVWLGINLAAFSIPNYWAYVCVAALIFGYASRRDTNPAALYMFSLLAMVPAGLDLPTMGVVKQLFMLDHFRLLSLVVLLPLTWQLARAHGNADHARPAVTGAGSGRRTLDLLLLGYIVLQILLLMPYESLTATARRSLLIGLDVALPYYALSRACHSREAIADIMAAFVLSIVVLVPLAMFEVAKSSLLYSVLQESWGTGRLITYLTRGDFLRAQVTAGHSIVLGYAMAMAIGLWLYLQSQIEQRGWRWLGSLALVAGLMLSFARGPWLGALLLLLVFVVLGPHRARRLFTISVVGGLAIAGALMSPYGAKIIDSLPFIGTLDASTVAYREQLASQSWLLIKQNPFFGTPGFWLYLEDLRQGEGIIDLVNAYAGIALTYGLVGLALFLGFFGSIIVKCLQQIRRLSSTDPDLSSMGASIVACVIAGLFVIATVNLYLSVAYLTWALAGLAAGYIGVAKETFVVSSDI